MPTATDRRVAKTRIALRDAMLNLLPLRGWDQVSIQEICDRANVGRSTFYMHYRSKDDLLSEGLNDLRDLLLRQVPADRKNQPFAFLRGLLAHVDEQKEVFRAVIGRRSGHSIEWRFREMVLQLVHSELAGRGLPDAKVALLGRYLAGGIVEVMAWWVDAPGAPPIAGVERQLLEFSLAAMHS